MPDVLPYHNLCFCYFLQVLSTHMKYSTIPKKVTIGKRLAQCLHPALPSGVHLKAIETYDIIFKCIGRQRLSLDLFTYSAGLFPLLGVYFLLFHSHLCWGAHRPCLSSSSLVSLSRFIFRQYAKNLMD